MQREAPARDPAFDELESEWRRIGDCSRALVADWEREIDNVASDERRLRSEGRWVRGRDDFLGVLGLHREEVRHSKIIAWLLDPCAPHGLGARVLAGVLRSAFGDEVLAALHEGLGSATPSCEVARGDARIDILVEAPGLTLVIENKVDALEGEGQCDAYFELFGRDPGARFILLTPTGRRPTSATCSAQEEFKTLGYGALRRIIRAALDQAPAGAGGRPIAEDYIRTLKQEFR